MVSRSTLEQHGDYDTWGDYLPKTDALNSENNNLGSSNKIKTCWLNQFSALKIYGPDAERFLQGQLTCNLTDITKGGSHYGACCSAKGRVVANFNISFDGESYWLVLPVKSAEVLDKHLQKYKVFFKATIENCAQSHLIFGQWQLSNSSAATEIAKIENGHQLVISNNRQILIVAEDSLEDEGISFAPTLDWQLANISDGIYFVDNDQHEQWIPQHINWHKLDGISFNKGCYTGQEIIARLQYLGKAKKALYHYSSAGNSASEDALAIISNTTTTKIFDSNGKTQGDIVLQRNGEVLAVLNGENPDVCLYLTDSQEFPLTLQNLPYTKKKDV
jgi:folate-binding protein YgfZ